jgi:hypothetical protein
MHWQVYCVADGYQTSRGIGAGHPIELAIMAGGKTVGSAEWPFADVICRHADPMNFSIDIDIGYTSFSLIDRIDLLGVDGLSAPADSANLKQSDSRPMFQFATTINGAF